MDVSIDGGRFLASGSVVVVADLSVDGVQTPFGNE
jgi:hypothetical protein